MNRFCVNCGTPLGSADRCPRCGYAAPPQPAPKGKKKGKLILLIVAAVAVVAVIPLVLYFLGVFSGPGPSSDKPGKIVEDTLERLDTEEYFSDVGRITDRESAADAALKTEAEALKAFAARGFGDVTVTARFNARGDYLGEVEISSGSSEKHPYYEASYMTPYGAVWTITLMGDAFYAEPISFNADGQWDAPRTLSETGRYLVYDDQENTFCTLTLKEDARVLKRIDRIDAETLDELDRWEVDDL